METNQKDILNIQTNAEENQNSKNYSNNEIIHREQIENSPLFIIGNNIEGYFLTFGKYRITERKNTIVEIRKEIEEDKWNIIIRLISTMIEITDQIKEKNI